MLLEAWREQRSLASLVPRTRARRGPGAGGSAGGEVRDVVAELVRAEPALSKEALVRRLMAGLDDPPAATTLRHLVDTERAAARREALGGANGLGRRVALACSPAFLRRAENDEPVGTVLGLAIDQATNLIFGSATGRDGLGVVAAAARNASVYVRALSVEVTGAEDPVLEVILAPSSNPVLSLREAKRFAALGDNIRLEEPRRDRPAGARLLQAVGPALGKIDLRPRATLPLPTLARQARDMSDDAIIKAYVDAEVTRHNRAILDRRPRAAVPLDQLVHSLMLVAG